MKRSTFAIVIAAALALSACAAPEGGLMDEQPMTMLTATPSALMAHHETKQQQAKQQADFRELFKEARRNEMQAETRVRMLEAQAKDLIDHNSYLKSRLEEVGAEYNDDPKIYYGEELVRETDYNEVARRILFPK